MTMTSTTQQKPNASIKITDTRSSSRREFEKQEEPSVMNSVLLTIGGILATLLMLLAVPAAMIAFGFLINNYTTQALLVVFGLFGIRIAIELFTSLMDTFIED